jgi:hypothetical protein
MKGNKGGLHAKLPGKGGSGSQQQKKKQKNKSNRNFLNQKRCEGQAFLMQGQKMQADGQR